LTVGRSASKSVSQTAFSALKYEYITLLSSCGDIIEACLTIMLSSARQNYTLPFWLLL